MLLVDDDERELCQRGKHGEARAEDDARVAARRVEPRRSARDVLQRAVHQGEARFREGGAKTALELRRQADLGHQHQRLTAALEHASDQVQINLGLSAAGNAMQEQRREAPELFRDLLFYARLIRRQDVRRHETRGGRLA